MRAFRVTLEKVATTPGLGDFQRLNPFIHALTPRRRSPPGRIVRPLQGVAPPHPPQQNLLRSRRQGSRLQALLAGLAMRHTIIVPSGSTRILKVMLVAPE